jgi:ABC-type nitrate/sulfonate/bicarbonate transport system substrate-binding protein
MFHLWITDLDSPSYFVATAALQLGLFREQGIDIEIVFNTKQGPELMREGKVDFIAGAAFAGERAYPEWKGIKLLCALSQYSYWFLAVRKDLDVRQGDLDALKGLRISSAQTFPGMGLRHMLKDAGFDLDRDRITILPPPPPVGDKGWMGRNGVDAVVSGAADAFWGNGMRVALGEAMGVTKMHLDLRRGDGPPDARSYNFPALTTTQRLIDENPQVAAGAVRAIVKAQKMLKADPSLATSVAEGLFPEDEVALIAPLIARDAPFYDPRISHDAIDGLMRFAVSRGLVSSPVPYEAIVATQFSALWENMEC